MSASHYDEKNGEKKTLPAMQKHTEIGTTQAVALRQENKMRDASGESQLEVLKTSSEILRQGVSDSMIYADNAMSELGSRMEGMFRNEIHPEDPEKVSVAAGCARTIADLIRAKNEAMVLLKGSDD